MSQITMTQPEFTENTLKPTLFYRPGSCALAPHIVFEWSGLDYTATKAMRDDPELLKVSPAGVVPALVVDETRGLTQASAILQHIAVAVGRDDLLGYGDPVTRDQVAMWLAFFTGDFHPAFWPYFSPKSYIIDEGTTHHPAIVQAALERIDSGLSHINARLKGREYLVGDSKTVVDAYAVPMLRWAKHIDGIEFTKYTEIVRFYDHMIADKGVRAAMQEHGISP